LIFEFYTGPSCLVERRTSLRSLETAFTFRAVCTRRGRFARPRYFSRVRTRWPTLADGRRRPNFYASEARFCSRSPVPRVCAQRNFPRTADALKLTEYKHSGFKQLWNKFIVAIQIHGRSRRKKNHAVARFASFAHDFDRFAVPLQKRPRAWPPAASLPFRSAAGTPAPDDCAPAGRSPAHASSTSARCG